MTSKVTITDSGVGSQTRVGREHCRDSIDKLDVFKSSGPNAIHFGVFNILSEIIAEPLVIIVEG